MAELTIIKNSVPFTLTGGETLKFGENQIKEIIVKKNDNSISIWQRDPSKVIINMISPTSISLSNPNFTYSNIITVSATLSADSDIIPSSVKVNGTTVKVTNNRIDYDLKLEEGTLNSVTVEAMNSGGTKISKVTYVRHLKSNPTRTNLCNPYTTEVEEDIEKRYNELGELFYYRQQKASSTNRVLTISVPKGVKTIQSIGSYGGEGVWGGSGKIEIIDKTENKVLYTATKSTAVNNDTTIKSTSFSTGNCALSQDISFTHDVIIKYTFSTTMHQISRTTEGTYGSVGAIVSYYSTNIK